MIRLCAAADVPPEGCRRVGRGKRPAIAVYNLGGSFFATADRCTHGSASLSDGEIIDGNIYCPLHAGGFDIRTGRPSDPPCEEPLRTFRVELRDGMLFCDTDDPED